MKLPNCPICFEIFDNLENIAACACGHTFHLECLLDWARKSQAQQQPALCPSCKVRFETNPARGVVRRLFFSFQSDNEEQHDELRSQILLAEELVEGAFSREGELKALRKKLELSEALLASVEAAKSKEAAELEDRIGMAETMVASLREENQRLKKKAEVFDRISRMVQLVDLVDSIGVVSSESVPNELEQEWKEADKKKRKKKKKLQRENGSNSAELEKESISSESGFLEASPSFVTINQFETLIIEEGNTTAEHSSHSRFRLPHSADPLRDSVISQSNANVPLPCSDDNPELIGPSAQYFDSSSPSIDLHTDPNLDAVNPNLDAVNLNLHAVYPNTDAGDSNPDAVNLNLDSANSAQNAPYDVFFSDEEIEVSRDAETEYNPQYATVEEREKAKAAMKNFLSMPFRSSPDAVYREELQVMLEMTRQFAHVKYLNDAMRHDVVDVKFKNELRTNEGEIFRVILAFSSSASIRRFLEKLESARRLGEDPDIPVAFRLDVINSFVENVKSDEKPRETKVPELKESHDVNCNNSPNPVPMRCDTTPIILRPQNMRFRLPIPHNHRPPPPHLLRRPGFRPRFMPPFPLHRFR